MKGSSLVLRRREFEKYLLQVFVIRSILRGEDKLRQVHRKRNSTIENGGCAMCVRDQIAWLRSHPGILQLQAPLHIWVRS